MVLVRYGQRHSTGNIGRYWWRTRKAYNNSGDESISHSRATRAGGSKQVYQVRVSVLMRSCAFVTIFS